MKTIDGEPYVIIKGTKTGYNHWDLTAIVDGAPSAIADGHRFTVTVVDENGLAVTGASNLSAVSVTGSAADTTVSNLNVGDQIDFQAIGRMELGPVLDALTGSDTEVALPIEFVLLAAQ